MRQPPTSAITSAPAMTDSRTVTPSGSEKLQKNRCTRACSRFCRMNIRTTIPSRAARALSPPLLTEVRHVVCDEGTTRKTLWRAGDGTLLESVLMRYPDRNTLCISSQAGCGMACPFCATGQGGLAATPRNFLRDTAISVFVLSWIPLLASFAVLMLLEPRGNPRVLTFMILVVCSDVGGYVAGGRNGIACHVVIIPDRYGYMHVYPPVGDGMSRGCDRSIVALAARGPGRMGHWRGYDYPPSACVRCPAPWYAAPAPHLRELRGSWQRARNSP
ncbi:hypothetical protein AWN90_21405 [Nocardia terpenica]|uniref:Uncharacterized protein n=1 Tax=Nocardia terpenica TaxID=455432 RepID=A0A164NR71_9NOCA|nr:hypothetical protein AWN90_21405 [Nocardia terpenica]